MKSSIWDKQLNLKAQNLFGHIWKIQDCNDVIVALLKERRVILGGDILRQEDGRYRYDGSGWYYNGTSCEEWAQKARDYFASWTPRDDMAVVFDFEPDVTDFHYYYLPDPE